MMQSNNFVDLLEERRKDCDIKWVSRPTKPVFPRKLPPELVYTRKQIIEATLSDTKVVEVIESIAIARNVPVSIVIKEARSMLEEMANRSHMPTVRWIGWFTTKALKRLLMSIRLNESILLTIKNQMPASQVQYIYAPSHRSYLDFILLSYILFSYDMAIPNIASGMDFYHMKVVGELMRNLGAFYMRRTFSTDPLYKEIFKAYINNLVRYSDRAIEFFIEGTRSRSQKTLSPKFGMLNSILDGLFRSDVIDIQFIPVSISYEKPVEELLFAYELLGVPKPPESTSALIRSISIFREPYAYGNVFFKFAPPISAAKYMDRRTRAVSALSPHAKIPPHITRKIAYDIVDCHKKNTVLTPFNLIALLFNEKVHSEPKEFYNLDNLFEDYCWIKKILVEKFQVTVNPPATNIQRNNEAEDLNKSEVLESLKTHNNLLYTDLQQNIRLKNRHVGISSMNKIKGHPLKDETLKITVPTINIMIYVNPVFAYLSRPAMVAWCVKLPSKEMSIKRYLMLRTLFTAEFALLTDLSESDLVKEYEEISAFLERENSIQYSNESVLSSSNRFHSILCNLLMPFIASLYTICKTLLQWDNVIPCSDKYIIKESQRRVEESLYQETSFIKHPYSLVLDLYTSLLSSLLVCGNIARDEISGLFKPNRAALETIIIDLEDILNQRSIGSYMDLASSLIPEEILNLRAKL